MGVSLVVGDPALTIHARPIRECVATKSESPVTRFDRAADACSGGMHALSICSPRLSKRGVVQCPSVSTGAQVPKLKPAAAKDALVMLFCTRQ